MKKTMQLPYFLFAKIGDVDKFSYLIGKLNEIGNPLSNTINGKEFGGINYTLNDVYPSPLVSLYANPVESLIYLGVTSPDPGDSKYIKIDLASPTIFPRTLAAFIKDNVFGPPEISLVEYSYLTGFEKKDWSKASKDELKKEIEKQDKVRTIVDHL